jgi:hypothetical protein
MALNRREFLGEISGIRGKNDELPEAARAAILSQVVDGRRLRSPSILTSAVKPSTTLLNGSQNTTQWPHYRVLVVLTS